MSGSENSTAASATRIRQPPENSPSDRCLRGFVEAEPLEDPGRPRRGVMRLDIDKARVDLGDALRIARGFRFGHQRVALDVGGEHEVDQAFRAGRRFLFDAADACALGDTIVAALRRKLAAEKRKSVVLPAPLRPTSPTCAPDGSAALALSIRRRSPSR